MLRSWKRKGSSQSTRSSPPVGDGKAAHRTPAARKHCASGPGTQPRNAATTPRERPRPAHRRRLGRILLGPLRRRGRARGVQARQRDDARRDGRRGDGGLRRGAPQSGRQGVGSPGQRDGAAQESRLGRAERTEHRETRRIDPFVVRLDDSALGGKTEVEPVSGARVEGEARWCRRRAWRLTVRGESSWWHSRHEAEWRAWKLRVAQRAREAIRRRRQDAARRREVPADERTCSRGCGRCRRTAWRWRDWWRRLALARRRPICRVAAAREARAFRDWGARSASVDGSSGRGLGTTGAATDGRRGRGGSGRRGKAVVARHREDPAHR